MIVRMEGTEQLWNVPTQLCTDLLRARDAEALLFDLPMVERCDGSPKKQIAVLGLQELFA